MKYENVILIARVMRKCEPKEYVIDGKNVVSYSVILDQGDIMPTVKVKEDLYNVLEPNKEYAFSCTVDTSQAKDKDRFIINKELASGIVADLNNHLEIGLAFPETKKKVESNS